MYIVVFITCANKIEAQKITNGLINEKLAACVNIIENVNSHFWWEGKVDNALEVMLITKTRKTLLNKLIKKVKSIHSYKVPEIIALPIVGANKDYTDWIYESTA